MKRQETYEIALDLRPSDMLLLPAITERAQARLVEKIEADGFTPLGEATIVDKYKWIGAARKWIPYTQPTEAEVTGVKVIWRMNARSR